MLDGRSLVDACVAQGCRFFTGVPDSVLGAFSRSCQALAPPARHVVAANEGNAIGLAAGWWLGHRSVPLVYLQNSGLGNAVNPLMSLAHAEVYGLPMVLLVGWRGRPGAKDEGQHRAQGRVTPGLLELMQIPWHEISAGEHAAQVVQTAFEQALSRRSPAAVLVPKGLVASEPDTAAGAHADTDADSGFSRTDAVRELMACIGPDDAVVGSTGYISRDLFGRWGEADRNPQQLFLSVGSMGHASQIAGGIAMARPDRRVWCIDGDGAFLMHLGGAAAMATQQPANLIHVVLDNGVHASVGHVPTCAPRLDLADVARALGYAKVASVNDGPSLREAATGARRRLECALIHARIGLAEKAALGRPPEPLERLGRSFESFLSSPDSRSGD